MESAVAFLNLYHQDGLMSEANSARMQLRAHTHMRDHSKLSIYNLKVQRESRGECALHGVHAE
jgi:hypothetical protein